MKHHFKATLLIASCLICVQATAVEFKFSDTAVVPAATVTVAGTFNDWTPEATPLVPSESEPRTFTLSIPLQDGEYEYKYRVVDAEGNEYWINDRSTAWYTLDGHGGVNNIIAIENGEKKLPTDLTLFSCPAPGVDWVNLAGDFNGWKQGSIDLREDEYGIWSCWLRIQPPATYKFILPNDWDSAFYEMTLPDGRSGENGFLPTADYEELANNPAFDDAGRSVAAPRTLAERQDLIEAATRLDKAGEYRAAIASLRAASKSVGARPDSATASTAAEAILEEARIHRRYGFIDRATESWVRIVNELPNSPPARIALYELADHRAYDEKKFEEGRDLWRRLTVSTEDPIELAKLHWKIGNAFSLEGRWTEGITSLLKASDICSKSKIQNDDAMYAWAHIECSLGIAQVASGQQRKGIKTLERAIELSPWPDSEVVRVSRGWLDRARKELEIQESVKVEAKTDGAKGGVK